MGLPLGAMLRGTSGSMSQAPRPDGLEEGLHPMNTCPASHVFSGRGPLNSPEGGAFDGTEEAQGPGVCGE